MSRSVAFDSTGAMYVTGGLGSSDFPFPDPNAYDTTFATGGSALGGQGPMDAFLAKFDANGQHLWTTAFGGPNYERAYAMVVDESGPNPGVILVGRAGPGMTTTNGVVQPGFAGDNAPNSAYGQQDGFVAKFSFDGRSLLWSTYIGGAGSGFVRGVDVDSQGRAHIGFVAISESSPYVTNNAVRNTRQGTADATYLVLSEDGSSVEYGTYLGGTSTGYIEPISAIQVIENNGVFAGSYITFVDNASDVATTPNAFQPNHGGAEDMVVAKLNGSFGLDWMTYLGGSQSEFMETHGLTIDASGRPVIVALTRASNFPTTPNAFQTVFGGGTADGFVSILSTNGQTLVASSLFGGSRSDGFEGTEMLSDGSILTTGTTNSQGLPDTSNSFQTFLGGSNDGMLVRWAADQSSVLDFTYLGGTGTDRLNDVATTPSGIIGLSGAGGSSPYPTVNSNDSSVDGEWGAVYGRLEPN